MDPFEVNVPFVEASSVAVDSYRENVYIVQPLADERTSHVWSVSLRHRNISRVRTIATFIQNAHFVAVNDSLVGLAAIRGGLRSVVLASPYSSELTTVVDLQDLMTPFVSAVDEGRGLYFIYRMGDSMILSVSLQSGSIRLLTVVPRLMAMQFDSLANALFLIRKMSDDVTSLEKFSLDRSVLESVSPLPSAIFSINSILFESRVQTLAYYEGQRIRVHSVTNFTTSSVLVSNVLGLFSTSLSYLSIRVLEFSQPFTIFVYGTGFGHTNLSPTLLFDGELCDTTLWISDSALSCQFLPSRFQSLADSNSISIDVIVLGRGTSVRFISAV